MMTVPQTYTIDWTCLQRTSKQYSVIFASPLEVASDVGQIVLDKAGKCGHPTGRNAPLHRQSRPRSHLLRLYSFYFQPEVVNNVIDDDMTQNVSQDAHLTV